MLQEMALKFLNGFSDNSECYFKQLSPENFQKDALFFKTVYRTSLKLHFEILLVII